MLELLRKKRTSMYRVCTRLCKDTKAKEYSSSRWNQLGEGTIRYLDDLSTIENEISQIIRPTKKDKQKAKNYKKNLRETIAKFGDFRDNQLQIEQVLKKPNKNQKRRCFLTQVFIRDEALKLQPNSI